MLDDHVDRRSLQLDQIRVGVDEVSAQRLAIREIRRDVDDVGLELRDVARPGREDGDAAVAAAAVAPSRSSKSSITTSEISRR